MNLNFSQVLACCLCFLLICPVWADEADRASSKNDKKPEKAEPPNTETSRSEQVSSDSESTDTSHNSEELTKPNGTENGKQTNGNEVQEASPKSDDETEKLKAQLGLDPKVDLKTLISQRNKREDVMELLHKLAELNYDDAKLELALSYFYGEPEFNMNEAYEYFMELSKKGNSVANLYLGFMYSIGLGPVKSSQAKALLYYTFSALSNNTFAKMALGYRYWSGISVAPNCEFGLSYYRAVAKVVEQHYTFSNSPSLQRIRLVEEVENPGTYNGVLDDDLIQYYQFLADKGDIQAQVGLGQLHFQGGRGVLQNQYRAFHYFTMAADSGNTNAMAFLGKMYLEGNQVVEQSYENALKYFKMSAEKGNPIGQSGLGIMYLYGKGVNKDFKLAFKYFSQASLQGWVDGHLYVGIMYLNGYGVSKDYKTAIKYFTSASQSGHILGFYHLAEMHALGIGAMRSCTTAIELFKSVSERGEWATRMTEAHNDYKENRRAHAFIKYAVLSEIGYEVAQSNAAFMLDRQEVPELFNSSEVFSRAFMYWSRSASQGYSVARVKLGDYHFYGLGTKVDYELAANQYRLASEVQNNAQALFNLGYMYETGLGLKRDIYLAKRYYDLAAVTSTDAQVPVALALVKLFFIFTYEYFQNAKLNDLSLLPSAWFGSDWDLYLITILTILLGTIFYYRRQVGG